MNQITFLKVVVFTGIILLLASCRVHYKIDDKETQTSVFTLDSLSIPAGDSLSLAIISPYKASMQEQMDEVLGYSERAMTKDQPEGLLNDFAADVILNISNKYYHAEKGAKVDLCLLNNGGLRGSLPKGEIKMRNVFDLMPFENKISVITLNGSKTKDLLNHVAHAGGLPLAGVSMGIKDDKAVNVLINSIPFDTMQNYIIATSDYLADGGDNLSCFQNPLKRVDLSQKVRDAIVEYLRALTHDGKTVNVKLDRRIYYE